ncbi:MAG: hypothetical protein ABI995_00990 [Acidobacteriota bacterium]
MNDYTNPENKDHREGPVARAIEQETAKLPSDTFLWAALGAIGASAILQLIGKREVSNFIGQWAPTLLIFGLYNKMVKQHGSDGEEAHAVVRRSGEKEAQPYPSY